ncbi:hypothetical protein Zmor_024028 [Zophobas morio]|uniref:DUF4817 domain-containing protein n=1 Tax=Zophobas morio TaxID=2755281 RepID=A0AA38HZT6_9CUCU|nr:hypothetical protein Zmor_024028 [Zophobas morio]
MIQLNRSTLPADIGCNGIVRVFRIPSTSVILWNRFDLKFLPWSEFNSNRTPIVLIQLSINIFVKCVRNVSFAARIYADRYPERRAPADTNFKRLENQMRANWPPIKLSKQRVTTGEEHELEVIQIL